MSWLRLNIPRICAANPGPHYAFPNPAPAGRPLTKGAEGPHDQSPG